MTNATTTQPSVPGRLAKFVLCRAPNGALAVVRREGFKRNQRAYTFIAAFRTQWAAEYKRDAMKEGEQR